MAAPADFSVNTSACKIWKPIIPLCRGKYNIFSMRSVKGEAKEKKMPDTQLAVAYDRCEQQVRQVYTDGNVQVLNSRRQTHRLIGIRL